MNQRKIQFNGNPTVLGKHWEGKRASAEELKLGLEQMRHLSQASMEQRQVHLRSLQED